MGTYVTSDACDFADRVTEVRETIQKRSETNFIVAMNEPFHDGRTLIYIACFEGRLSHVKVLFDLGCNPKAKIQLEGNLSEDCLEVAARMGFSEIVEFLLTKVEYHKVTLRKINESKEVDKKCKTQIRKKLKKGFLGRCGCF